MSEAANVYARFKEVFGGRKTSYLRRVAAQSAVQTDPDDESAQPFGSHRDPVSLGSAFGVVTRRFGWETPIAQAELIAAWERIAGPDTAAHSTPMHIDDGTLVVQCDSTAWATQLRAMRSHILRAIAEGFSEARVVDIRFLNPGAPSWKRGLRSVPGRGPRDTYG